MMRSLNRAAALVVGLTMGTGAAAAQSRPELSLPIVCEPQKTCFIQNYVDRDPGPGVQDYACGGATYDKHSGVDFRVLSAAATASGVPVVASADGRVKGVRDGKPDIFLRDQPPNGVAGQECGNGVVLDHGDGWETQYCHLKSGSLKVAVGQAIKRGDPLGTVGYSGMADFAHVHLSVRHNGQSIDPFMPDGDGTACSTETAAAGLWQPGAVAPFAYRAGSIMSVGFAGAPPDLRQLETDDHLVVPLSGESAALIFYGRFINLVKGDKIYTAIKGPSGLVAETTSEPIDRNKATYISFAGKKRRDAAWPKGIYDGRIEILRDGKITATATAQIEIR